MPNPEAEAVGVFVMTQGDVPFQSLLVIPAETASDLANSWLHRQLDDPLWLVDAEFHPTGFDGDPKPLQFWMLPQLATLRRRPEKYPYPREQWAGK